MRRTEFPTDHDLCTPCPFKGRATESTDLGTLNVAMRVVRHAALLDLRRFLHRFLPGATSGLP